MTSWAARAIRLVPLFLVVIVAGCVSEHREQEVGDLMAIDINAQIPLVRDSALNAYITTLGSTLAQVSERPGLSYRFYVINSPSVNAFALPGGHIYLSRGLIEQTRSGSELAAALAHEIGHVAERHGVAKMERQLRTGSLVSTLYDLILGGEPEILQRDALQIGSILWNARHSRRAEKQADAKAVEYLQRAGLDPHAMVSLLRKLVAVESQDSSLVAGWFSTHPLTKERIAQAERAIDDTLGEIEVAADEPVALLPEYLERYPLFLERLASVPGPSLLR
ncbi:MAG TPA: M48 family metallopeptidase [Longimicrobiaceae bacterium]